MGDVANSRNAALRALYEEWNAPLELLERTTGRVEGGLSRVAKRQGWCRKHSTRVIQKKLLACFDSQLAVFSGVGSEEKCDENRIRVLSAMAKTLDILASTDVRLSTLKMNQQGRGKGEQEKSSGTKSPDETAIASATQYSPAELEELNRQIEEMVEAMP